jgi:hypothetical protein
MTTKQKYRNFELKFEVKLDLGLNSGCQIRSILLREGAHLIGPQVEIAGGKSGFIYGEAMKKKRMVPDNFGLALIWRRKKQNQSKVPLNQVNGTHF